MGNTTIADAEASAANLLQTFTQATFKPGEFFPKPAYRRSKVGPISFAIIVSQLAILPDMLESLLGIEGRPPQPFHALGMIAGAMVVATLGMYATAGILHLVLRVAGPGKPSIRTNSEQTASPDGRYAPPAEDEARAPGLGPFRETLAAVSYSRAPLVLTLLDPYGALVGTLWWVGLLGFALAKVHRISMVRAYLANIGVIVGPVFFALAIRVGVVEAFKIPSGSMTPSLMMGDHIFVNKLAYKQSTPKYGDVILFKFPENEAQDFIKRVIALPGDTLEVINGRPIVNGKLASHCRIGTWKNGGSPLYVEFLGESAYLTLYDELFESNGPDEKTCSSNADCEEGQCRAGICGRLQGPFKVAPGEVWVMGDNRHNSHDSRSWRGGMGAGVPFANLKGRASYVWLNVNEFGNIGTGRIGLDIMGKPELPTTVEAPIREALEKCLRERN